MRKSCLKCGLKHVGKAVILLSESELGYPMHFWLALANLSEAEDELVSKYPKLAAKIRKLRIEIEKDKNKGIELMKILEELDKLNKKEK